MKIIAFMIFLHILDDYVLQGILKDLKQKAFWQKDPIGKQEKYKYDFVMALAMHGLSWSFMVHLPFIFEPSITYGLSFFIQAAFHAVVDHFKANKFKLNLIQDQLIHMWQLVLIYITFVVL